METTPEERAAKAAEIQKEFDMIKPTKLNLDDYELTKVLGTGSFGQVKLGRHKKTGEYFAVKMIKKEEIIRLKQTDHIHNEVKLLSMVQHPFIVKMKGMTQDSKYLYLVLELINGGELFTYIREQKWLDIREVAYYAAQVVLMFEYLHSKNIVYRDLKPENILLDSEGYLNLTDFGFAKIIDGRTYTLCGTPEYIAPEILLNKGHGKSVDWWTLGILIYEMMLGYTPFVDDDPMVIYQRVLKCKIKFPTGFSPNTKSLIKHLLTTDLSKRYGNLKRGVQDIKDHRFFKDIVFEDLLARKTKMRYIPNIKDKSDVSLFCNYDEPEFVSMSIVPSEDPFLLW